LIVAIASFFAPSYPAGILCFYFFIAWMLWIGCAWVDISRRKLLRIFYLWLAIDLSILVCFLSVASSAGDVTNSQGSEMVWGIAYLPSILPFGLIVNARPASFDFLTVGLMNISVNILGPTFGHVFGTWALLSLVSMIQCSLVVGLMYFLRWINKIFFGVGNVAW